MFETSGIGPRTYPPLLSSSFAHSRLLFLSFSPSYRLTLSKSFRTNRKHCTEQGCRVGVAGNRMFLGGVGFPRTLGFGYFCPTPEIQLNNFLHRTLKLGIPDEMARFLKLSVEHLLCTTICIGWYLLQNCQTSFTFCWRVGNFGAMSESEI